MRRLDIRRRITGEVRSRDRTRPADWMKRKLLVKNILIDEERGSGGSYQNINRPGPDCCQAECI